MFIKIYLVATAVFVAIDAVWLGLIATNFYKNQIGWLLKENPDFIAAIIFYLLFILGLVVFVISPALKNGSMSHALIYGALFGLITYATYDLTNQATVKDWPVLVTVVDLIWGTVLASTVSTATFFLIQKFFS